MANIFLLTTIVIVVSSFVNCDRTAFLRNVNSLKQPVPLHLRHDQEESKRNMVKDQGQPRRDLRMGLLEPLLSWPLGPNHQNKEQTEERIRQLQNKLTPSKNIIPIRTLNQPLQKPDNEVKLYETKRHKREAIGLDNNNRQKRDAVINSLLRPDMMMQHHVQPSLVQHNEVKHQEAEDTPEKRDKRQILLMIKQQPLVFRKKARTTPNPFIRETNIADYDIVKTDVDKAEVDLIDTMDTNSYQLSPIQKALSEFTKMLLNLKIWLDTPKEDPLLKLKNYNRIKRSPKMSKLYKKQKLAKKKRKKKKQQKLTPRQIKHYRRIREHKEKRRRILHKKLKEKRRLRHKKLGTGPYNKSIIDYYGVYFDPPSSQLNDSLYDTVYDTDAIDTKELYEEHLKNYPDYSGEREDEDEDYSTEESTDQDGGNSTLDYDTSQSNQLNDSMFNSIYDTEAIDSDQLYEEQMKNYPDSKEGSESEDKNSYKKESSGSSEGDDDKGKDNTPKTSAEIKNKDKTSTKSRDLKNIDKGQHIQNMKGKTQVKLKTDTKILHKTNNKHQNTPILKVDTKYKEKHKVIERKLPLKLQHIKQSSNNLRENKLKSERSFSKIPLMAEVVEDTSNLIDVILNDELDHDSPNMGLNLQHLIGPKQKLYVPQISSRNIIPFIMRPINRRIPI